MSPPSHTHSKWAKACKHLRSPQQYLGSDCPRLERALDSEIGALNPYALDWPVCVGGDAAGDKRKAGRAQRAWLLHHAYGHGDAEKQQGLGIIDIKDYEPCEVRCV